METVRERLAKALLESKRPMSVYELHVAVGAEMRPEELYGELEHVAASLKRRGYRLRMVPARCRACGYEFRDRKKLKRPSRCPNCRSERIEPPLFYVEATF